MSLSLKRRFSRWLCLVVFGAAGSASQTPAVPLPENQRSAIEQLGGRNGLGAATVTSVAQDNQGTLWIGTETGLFRYDGASVKRFGREDGLPGELVDLVLVATDGSVWVRTRRGIARLDHEKFVALLKADEASGLREALQSLAPDAKGTVFVAAGNGLLRINSDGTHRLYGPADGLRSGHIDTARQKNIPWWQRWWAWPGALGLIALLTSTFVRQRNKLHEREKEQLEAAVAARSADLAKANKELQESSLRDPLTGTYNRRFFQAAIKADASQAIRAYRDAKGNPAAGHCDLLFYFIDMDNFKSVNDDYGHDAGDRVLVEVANRLAQVVRSSDFLIRWGGEEFLIVCRSANRDEGDVMAGRILRIIGSKPFVVRDGKAVTRTCSVGWAPFPWESASSIPVEDVLRLSDRGLYLAKREGRNCAVGVMLGRAVDLTNLRYSDIENAKDPEILKEVLTAGPSVD